LGDQRLLDGTKIRRADLDILGFELEFIRSVDLDWLRLNKRPGELQRSD
jgi:hypothetical protein